MKEKLVEAVHDVGLTKNWHNVAGMSSSKFSYTKSKVYETHFRRTSEEFQKHFRSILEALVVFSC